MIHYADLTWPEIAVLPRHLPLLIPLGRDEYDYVAILRKLLAEGQLSGAKPHTAQSGQAVVLPPIPYGFRRADEDAAGQLHVCPVLLRRVLLGIQRELRAQAFEQVVFLNGHGDQGLRAYGLEVIDVPCQRKVGIDFPADLSHFEFR